MSDLDMSVVVNRGLLGLPPLECNDLVVYTVGASFLGTVVSWQREQITSRYVHGSVTTNRVMQQVQEQLSFEVEGVTNLDRTRSTAQLQANMDTLVTAFEQDSYVLDVFIEGAHYSYSCETADYQLAWVGPRWMARQGMVSFTMPRQPVPLVGAT